jgi:hypothetical protein
VCARLNLFPDDLPLPRLVQDMLARNDQPMNPSNLSGTWYGSPKPISRERSPWIVSEFM